MKNEQKPPASGAGKRIVAVAVVRCLQWCRWGGQWGWWLLPAGASFAVVLVVPVVLAGASFMVMLVGLVVGLPVAGASSVVLVTGGSGGVGSAAGGGGDLSSSPTSCPSIIVIMAVLVGCWAVAALLLLWLLVVASLNLIGQLVCEHNITATDTAFEPKSEPRSRY